MQPVAAPDEASAGGEDEKSYAEAKSSQGSTLIARPLKPATSAAKKAANLAAMRQASAFQFVRVSVSRKGARKSFIIPKARMIPAKHPNTVSVSVEEASHFGNLASIIPEQKRDPGFVESDSSEDHHEVTKPSQVIATKREPQVFSQDAVPGQTHAEAIPAIVALPAETRLPVTTDGASLESTVGKGPPSTSAQLQTAAGFVRARFDSFARYTTSALHLGLSKEHSSEGGEEHDHHLGEHDQHGNVKAARHQGENSLSQDSAHSRVLSRPQGRRHHSVDGSEVDEAAYERAMKAKELIQDVGRVVGVFHRLGLPETSWRNKMPYREPRAPFLARGLKRPEEQHFESEDEKRKSIRESRKLQPFMFGEIPSWSWLAADIGLFAFLTCNPRWPWSLN